MRGSYLLALVVSIIGLGIIDYRYKLALFHDMGRALKVLGLSLTVFISWDVLGIMFKIFFIGANPYLLGLRIGQFPFEEMFFLILLIYCSLVLYRFIAKKEQQ